MVEMGRKVVTEMMLMLLFIGMLTLAFSIQPAKASGPIYIYIMANGSISPSTANITSTDKVTYNFTGNNYAEIYVQRSNIKINGNGHILQGSGSGDGFYLSSVNNVTIQNMNMKNFTSGVYLTSSSGNTVSGNKITNATGDSVSLYLSSGNIVSGNNITNAIFTGVYLYSSCNNNIISGNTITNMTGSGVYLYSSSFNTVSGNTITKTGGEGVEFYSSCNNNTVSGNKITNATGDGVWLGSSSFNTVSGNTITKTGYGVALSSSSGNIFSGNNITKATVYGVWLGSSSGNKFYHNNFINNTHQVVNTTPSYANSWDNGYPSGGNYWSDYKGVDVKSGPKQDQPGSDGIGDTPYVIDANNTDRYPLMKPWPCQINPPAVGGIWVPVDKLALLAPYIALVSAILAATAATAILVKRKSRKKKQ
jgi:parallel beta-helix repeat protein